MDYLDVISLAEAKTYLGVDDTSRDAEITRMIKSAVTFIEKRTNHILVEQTKTYIFRQGCVRVYDYPIVSTTNTTSTNTVHNGYSTYLDSTADDIDFVLGYDALTDVPSELVEACYMMLKFFFFEQEGTGKIPMAVQDIIDANKRFLL
tara:strand:+ start:444 stop:887 length:444 start_codon:yes stop_codon:yes gene_type:complete